MPVLPLALCLSLLAADPPKVEPLELIEANKIYAEAIAKAEEEYRTTVKRLTGLHVAKLKVALEDLTKKGNLDGAVAVREAIEKLSALEPREMPPLNKHPLMGQVWTRPGGQVMFRRDGLVQTADGDWERRGLVTKWIPIGPRAVMLLIAKGRDRDLVELWLFNDAWTAYEGWDFEGNKLPTGRPVRRM
jgi:hypothetical protein